MYFILEGSAIFPALATLSDGGCAIYCTNLLKNCAKNIPGLSKNITGTSLRWAVSLYCTHYTLFTVLHSIYCIVRTMLYCRIGSTNTIANHKELGLFYASKRGGWTPRSNCELYMTCPKPIIEAGKGLAGFSHPREKLYNPTCRAFITSLNMNVVKDFIG